MSFALISLAVSVAVVVSMVLLAVRTLVSRRGTASAWLIAAICSAVVCNQILSWQEYAAYEPDLLRFDTGLWAPVLNVIRNTAPGLFMIQAHRLFVEEKSVPRWLLAAFGLQLGLELIAFALPSHAALNGAPAALELMFGGLALYWTLASWPDDLVETRRRARAVVLVLVALAMIAPILLLRLVSLPGAVSFYANTALSGFTFLIAACLMVLDGQTQEVLAAADTSTQISISPSMATEDEAALQQLQRLMDEEQIYLEPELKLSALARRAQVPEYRLRRVIHTRLGHRNFNAYLHTLRIHEACRQLKNPQSKRTPILTIALSVGYGSVNTFNRGFRAVMNCSPSDYRSGLEGSKVASDPAIAPQILKSVEG